MNEVIKWLESPDGEAWSRSVHASIPQNFVQVKDDYSDIEYREYDYIMLWYPPFAEIDEEFIQAIYA